MTFHFTRQRLAVFAACLAILCVFVYTAGVLTGLGLLMPTHDEIALLKTAKQPAAPALPAVHLPAVPSPLAPLTAVVAPPAAKQAAPQAATPTPSAQPQAASPAPAPAAPPAATASVADSSTQAAASTKPQYAVQVGCFMDEAHAKQWQSDLKDRGYTASIQTALDSDQREWHVVRINGFQTLDAALKAASDFTGKERMPAFVRRSNSL